MKSLSKFKYTLVLVVIWLACMIFVLATSTLPTKYAATEADAENLYALYERQGVMKSSLGYQCDWYEPHLVVYLATIIGALAFIVAIISFIKTNKPKLKKF